MQRGRCIGGAGTPARAGGLTLLRPGSCAGSELLLLLRLWLLLWLLLLLLLLLMLPQMLLRLWRLLGLLHCPA